MTPKLIPLALIAITCLTGCGTNSYTPTEHVLRDGVIPALNVSGEVAVDNRQTDAKEVLVYSYMGSNLASNYKDITQAMVEQVKKELNKNALKKSAGKSKTIEIQVTYLKSEYQMMWWKSELHYTATLGGAEKIEKNIRHGSGNLIQDLNGSIADAVVDLLNDSKVTAYLAE